MAKLLTLQKRGSFGPSTYMRTRYGVVERERVTPLNPKTVAQTNQRSIVALVASEWRGLTEEVRASWTNRAKLWPGNLTGFQAYVHLNAVLVSCGLPKLETPPHLPAFGQLSCTGLVADDTPALKLTQVTSAVAPDKFIIEATSPVEPGIQNVNSRFRRLLVVNGHAGPAADVDLTAAYIARFGQPLLGDRVAVRLTPMKDGFKGQPLEFSTFVVAHGGA